MSSALIMPVISDMSWPPEVSIWTGAPQAWSQPVMSSISGSCAASMRAASATTSALAVRAGSWAISAISMACS